MNKVKLIINERESDFEEQVNDFIKDKQIISIHYTTTPLTYTGNNFDEVYTKVEYSALIQYKE